jgi:hypothetical protein
MPSLPPLLALLGILAVLAAPQAAPAQDGITPPKAAQEPPAATPAPSPDPATDPSASAPQEPPSEPTTPEAAVDNAETVPQAYPEDRYLSMWDKNPFLLVTATIVQKTESFAKDWALAGISASGGAYRVSIYNKQTGKFERLKEGEAGKEFRLVSVQYNKDRAKSSVEVARGSETAKLTYDDSLMSRPVTVQNTQSTTGQPGQNPGAPGNPNLPPGAQASLQRGPDGQPIATNRGVPGMTRPGTPTSVPGRVGTPLPQTPAGVPGNPAINPAGGAPLNIPGATGAPPPVSRRRQLIPAPIQQSP